MTGQEIAGELGWGSQELVGKYKQIKERLHPLTWQLARCTKNKNLVRDDKKNLVQLDCTKVQWRETYFRPIISNLGLTERDNAIMRGQLKVIYNAYDYAELANEIKSFIYQSLITEAQLRQITGLSIDRYFQPWLTTEHVWTQEEIAEVVNLNQSEVSRIMQNRNFSEMHNFFKQGKPIDWICGHLPEMSNSTFLVKKD